MKIYLCFLFLEHGIENGHDPVLKLAVVVVGYKQIANSVDAFHSQILTSERELTEVGRSKALDEVLLYASSCGH